MQSLVGIYSPHHLAVNFAFHLHGALVVNMETQHVLVSNGVDDGVSMQRFDRLSVLVGLATKQLGCGAVFAALMGVYGKYWRTRKSEHKIALELACYLLAHIAELRAMTLVEYQHNVIFCKHLFQLFIIVKLGLHQVRQLLYGGDDDAYVIVFKLLQQYSRRTVTIGAVRFKVVVLLHGLVVQILTVYHKQHFLDSLHSRCQLGSFK